MEKEGKDEKGEKKESKSNLEDLLEKENLLEKETEKDFEKDRSEAEFDLDNLPTQILDFSFSEEFRIQALNLFFEKEGLDNTVELINRIVILYGSSTVSSLRNFLFAISKKSSIPSIAKILCSKGLLTVNSKDELAFESLNAVYPLFDNSTSTTYRFDLIKTLMNSEKHKEECRNYFCSLLENQRVDATFRCKMIFELRRKNDVQESENKEEEQNYIIPNAEYYMKEACLSFLRNKENPVYHRIICCQNLLGFQLSQEIKAETEDILLEIANNSQVEYNLRADATDVLLKFSERYLEQAKKIIFELGRIDRVGKPTTIYENAQNVHNEKIEESVREGITILHQFEIMKKNGKTLTFEDLEKELFELVQTPEQKEIVKVSLNRIYMDSALYGEYHSNLKNILLRIWSYIHGKNEEDKKELMNRLISELIDMAGTCSSGFVSRLINVLSGFGDFSLKISWYDQILANFSARLNAKIRDMDDLTFQEAILAEITLTGEYFVERRHFLRFFREVMPELREELWLEFEPHISSELFDTCFRTAVITYENGGI